MSTATRAALLLLSSSLLTAHFACGAPATASDKAPTAPSSLAPTAPPGAPANLDQAPSLKPIKRVAAAEKRIVGSWRSSELAGSQAAPGTMFFQPNGALLMAPDGFAPLVGTWSANNTTIAVHTKAQGDVHMRYTLTANHNELHLHYDNGLDQTFFRMIFHPDNPT